MAGTTITTLTADQFAARIARSMPNGWSSQTAKQPGGNLYGLLKTLGGDMSFAESSVAYALGSTRIQTAVGPELDAAARDFLGAALPRNPGESDTLYRARILAALPPTGATRPAIIAALVALTGSQPRVIEPWSPADTGAWDAGISYWDVDTQANPAIWTDPSLVFQGFIVTKAPPASSGGATIQCFDRGIGANGAYWDVPGYAFMEIQQLSASQVYATIARLHVLGTTVWVKIQDPAAFH